LLLTLGIAAAVGALVVVTARRLEEGAATERTSIADRARFQAELRLLEMERDALRDELRRRTVGNDADAERPWFCDRAPCDPGGIRPVRDRELRELAPQSDSTRRAPGRH